MKLAYLDCFSGISGDMFLGALVDAGLSPGRLESELRRLPLKDWRMRTEKVKRGALAATKVDFDIAEGHHHRTWKTIREMIGSCGLADSVRARALRIFSKLAEAEAAVHGVAVDEVHFHEVGAMDSILDIVGAAIALDAMGIESVACSALNVGSGTVETAHGTLPVPAPATMALLVNTPVYSNGTEAELVTPTGAAIVAATASEIGPVPAMTVTSAGYGAGTCDIERRPNVLRVLIGEAAEELAVYGSTDSELAAQESARK